VVRSAEAADRKPYVEDNADIFPISELISCIGSPGGHRSAAERASRIRDERPVSYAPGIFAGVERHRPNGDVARLDQHFLESCRRATEDFPSPLEGKRVYRNIQVLRAVAVYLVVLRHLGDSWNNYTGVHFGYKIDIAGGFSDMFFVISGFVLAQSALSRELRPVQFLTARFARIVPLYWLVTVLVYLSTLLGYRTFGTDAPDLSRLIRSLLFFPVVEHGTYLDPVVFVGWTLNLQVLTYVFFAIGLGLRAYIPDEVTVGSCLVILYGASELTGIQEISFFTSELLLLFLAGIALSRICEANRSLMLQWSTRFYSACAALGSLAFLSFAVFMKGALLRHQHLMTGAAAALVIFGAVGLELKGKSARSKAVLLQGSASYAIFLVHPLALQAVGKTMIVTKLNMTVAGTLLGYVISLGVVAGLGTLTYLWVDRPIHRTLKAALDQERGTNGTPPDLPLPANPV
jgi:exopolysaccharide production protein ExoZ